MCASAAARLLGLRFRIRPVHECLSLVECCVFSGIGLCDGPITRPEEYYRVCVCVLLGVLKCNDNPVHLH